jgi:predicted RND superfamily exporter protein
MLLVLYHDYKKGKSWLFFLTYLIVSLVWIALLNWLCSTGHGIVSWLMVFLPFSILLAYTIYIHNKKNAISVVDQVLEPVNSVTQIIGPAINNIGF